MKLLRIAFQKVPRQISPCLTSPKGTLRSDVLRSKPFINFSPFWEGNIFSQREERSHWNANETRRWPSHLHHLHKISDIHLISLLNCPPSPSPSPRLYLLILTANLSYPISHLPLSAVVYFFFQAVAVFVRRTQYFGPFTFWAILWEIYALFSATFTGLNSVAVY